jgi:hypothetical protein
MNKLQTFKAGLIALIGLASAGQAQVTLTDNNSTALINPYTQDGMYNWSVLTGSGAYVNQLAKQWFWYRVGNDRERSIDTISAPTLSEQTPNSVTTTYYDSLQRFSLKVKYTLQGGLPNSGTADIAEQITINNTSGSLLDFHFFQYSDFDLNGTPGNDLVSLGFLGSRIYVADQLDGGSLVEVVNTPGANHGEGAFVFTTLDKLNDGVATTLSDTWPAESGDSTWALQWDANIGVGGSLVISKDKRLELASVPEPGSAALMALMLGGLALRRRRP